MRVAVTGSSGELGQGRVAQLADHGHEVLRLVRRPAQAAGEVTWDPAGGTVDLAGLVGTEGVVHLAGAGLADRRWTAEYQRTIRDSRVLGTRTLVRAMAQLDPVPRVLVSQSGVDYYGSTGDAVIDEDSPGGQGFLADVTRAWEHEAVAAEDAGVRVVRTRTAPVMSAGGPSFGRLLTLSRLGLGGPLGNGRQWWSWITLPDQAAATRFLLESDVSGAVNLTAPEPARQVDIARAIGRATHRPALLPAPAIAMRLVVGGAASLALDSHRVVPIRLVEAGFIYQHPDLETACRWLAAR
jgi:uncharacterized protein (TIGR01777 family)